MPVDLQPRIRMDWKTYHEEYNPNNAETVIKANDIFNESTAVALTSVLALDPLIAKDAADVEIIPATMTNVRFVYLRVLTSRLAVAPVKGTITAKITMSDGGTDQTIAGKLIVIDNDLATITSIKVTNNEDDGTGVDLPVQAILGGKSS